MRVTKVELTAERHRLSIPFLVLAVLLGLLLLVQGVVASGLGGFISEKLLSRDGVTNSDLLIAREGVSSPSLDIGMGPSVATLEATGISFHVGGTSATLNGNVASLNGFPSSDVWFEWGYAPGVLVNITATQVAAAPGPFSVVISGFAPDTIYYRFAGSDDGTNYGGVVRVIPSEATGSLFLMTQTVLFIWIGIVLLMVLGLIYSGMPLIPVLLVGAVLIVIGLAGIGPILAAFRSWWGG